MTSAPTSAKRLFARGSFAEASRISDVLRAETTGGVLLILAAAAALVWANADGESYAGLRDTVVGPDALHLHLSLATWAADGLLAIFFFVAGLEVKREFVAGDLRDPSRAALPVVAAVGGMVVPALVFTGVALAGGGDASGWAVPTATDIAFALAVLAVISTHLPAGLRTFLLALAVVDDLLAITVIAVFYTSDLHVAWLAAAAVPLALFAALVQRRVRTGWLLVPLALAVWALVHASGVHATVAGVLLAFTVPVRPRGDRPGPGLAEHLEHLVRPVSSGVAAPVFAFFAAGVTLGGLSGVGEALTDPVALGVVAGLVVGKPLGIVGCTWLLHTFTHADLDEELSWLDVVGMAVLAGVGFTVSLLIGELAYAGEPDLVEHVTVAVLVGSLLAALVATAVLRARNRVYRRICALEELDADGDGVPDVFERPPLRSP